ncbi:MAG: hypothetical protein NVS3B18_15760 [Candidatus Dormibacteria bacterium]
MQRPNIKRRIALAGGTALIAAAGVGGYLAMSGGSAANVHLTAAPAPALVTTPDNAAAATEPDTDTVQQGGQSGVQDTTGVDTATTTAATGAEATSTEADGPGGNADPAGSAGQVGDNNN